MDLFFLRALLRGKLMTTPKFESSMEQLRIDAERYRQVEKSDKLKEFLALEQVVNSPEFQSKKRELTTKKYKDSDEAKKLNELKKLSADKFVRKYLKDGSEEGRSAVKRYIELKAETETDTFKKMNAFWQDADRWSSTEEGKKEVQYEAFKKDADILFFKNANVKAIENVEQFTLAYQDDFTWNRLENSDWQSGVIYPSKDFQKDHSYINEKQAYNQGKNVETADSVLRIRTIKETKKAPAWDEKRGMVMKEFSFTSDMISNPKVAIEEGEVVQVKVRCHGHLNHGIYLRSPKHIPFVSLFNYNGLKLYVGLKDSVKNNEHLHLVDGLQPLNFAIYTVSLQKDEIIWYINNLELYRTKNTLPKGEKLYMHIYSFLFEKVNTRYATAGDLEVDWVRVYKPAK